LFSQNAPQMTAITYKGDAPAAPTPTFKMLSGRRFESIPDEELELADVITDIVGVLNYTSTLDLVFKRYISLLKPGGKIFIFLPSPITWILTGDERISLFEWLSRIEGLRVRELPTKPGEFNRSSFVIEVKSNKIDIPSLALEDSVHRHAVIRVFREN
ncbi:MAG: hypothetical protein V4692_09070, partial [Bdellovibrionota bacterium]